MPSELFMKKKKVFTRQVASVLLFNSVGREPCPTVEPHSNRVLLQIKLSSGKASTSELESLGKIKIKVFTSGLEA